MANKKIQSVNLLPEIFRTDKNSKFLSSTLDQLIQPAQLERIDSYVGSKLTPNYVSTSDFYVPEVLKLRRDYQLDPALIIYNSSTVVQDVIAIDDVINEIKLQGGSVDNLDRLFRTDFYSFNPHIDWDKLINFQEYFWLTTGPDPILIIDDNLVVETDIIGQLSYTSNTRVTLSNGMMVQFSGTNISDTYLSKQFWVEGVGDSIRLLDYEDFLTAGKISTIYDENFDANGFDSFPFDGNKTLPIDPDYITINRASRDLNPWSRYNRWVHAEVIRVSAEANGQVPVYPASKRARRPIVEFNADLKLFNFGNVAAGNVDYIDTITTDAFGTVEGSAGFYVDANKFGRSVKLEHGDRVIFNADTDPDVRGVVYEVSFDIIKNKSYLRLTNPVIPTNGSSVSVLKGSEYAGTSWWFNGDKWQYSQQHTTLNQAPLFDLFDDEGISYSDNTTYLSNFTGNKIFGYEIGSGTNDAILGFPLKYKNSVSVGSYLFKNYAGSETITITSGQSNIVVPTSLAYYKFTTDLGDVYYNSWTTGNEYKLPILQFQTTSEPTSTIAISAIDDAVNQEFSLDVFVNSLKINDNSFSLVTSSGQVFVNFANPLLANDNVLLKISTSAPSNDNGYYETPLGLTNNPLNGNISNFTLTELEDHLLSMTQSDPRFIGEFPGISNLRDIPGSEKYGKRLIANANPMAFAHMFVGKKEHNVIDAVTKSADQYSQFKFAFLKQLQSVQYATSPVDALDIVLSELNLNKDILSPWYLSDMVAYGADVNVRNWTVTNAKNTTYPLSSDFDPSKLGLRSVLVYLNSEQLLLGIDYNFNLNDASVTIIKKLKKGDLLVVKDYHSTEGNYIPSTPTKLGLYPKFTPSIFLDTTYITPVNVIQGHDGSIIVAYNDYRDDIILELEKRIYNNIKSEYRAELFDINSVLPGAFKNTAFSADEVNSILQGDFNKWAGFYGVDYTTNTGETDNPFTFNYYGSYSPLIEKSVSGYWRSLYKHFYGTDRPHTAPWEMLGFSEKPSWWEKQYGPAPYTSGNKILWNDLENGKIRQGKFAGINTLYQRPGLSQIIPVDKNGVLLDPTVNLVTNITPFNKRQGWVFGDQSPAETAWRRSSYYPFALQKLLALTNPASYTALMYDLSRVKQNISGQWTYGDNCAFFDIRTVAIHGEHNTLTSGYSVYISEIGQQRSAGYISQLKSDLSYLNFNLFHKVGGFISKDKLQITVDAIDPTSTSQGALLSPEDYNLILNVSNPVKSIGISGIVIQKTNGKFVIKGYDKTSPYFNTLGIIRNQNTPTLVVGGISSPYVNWETSNGSGSSGLDITETTTAASATTGKFYSKGQIVRYGNNFYNVLVSHQAETSFNPAYYQVLPSLPSTGGATVQVAARFDNNIISYPYGTEFTHIQEVYDFIIGYGKWLESQGFIFDEFNNDLEAVIDWNFTAKEFLYWTTQNWAENSIIALSPFADKIKYAFTESVVDNIFDSFYEYSVLKSDGSMLPQNFLDVTRNDGVCTIQTNVATEGIYFARLNSVQKEHAIIFNNTTIFSDTIYSIETGYRQLRMKFSGFRTANWNGDYFSPGFMYDTAIVNDWKIYTDYLAGDTVRFSGKYYSAIKNINGTASFDFTKWDELGSKPVAGLLPNFDYKISQFEDFYSLDIDNFETGVQAMAQHLTGYTPRKYLSSILTDPIAQYKFYQGFIREKGTKNAISKLSKSSIHNHQGEFTYNEEWAFRVGKYGSYNTYQELEIPLVEGTFFDNPQVIEFVDTVPASTPNNLKVYSTASDWVIVPEDYISTQTFTVYPGTFKDTNLTLPVAGYVRVDDITATARNEASLLDIADNTAINDGDTFWIGFKDNSDWDVYRYTHVPATITAVDTLLSNNNLTFTTDNFHTLQVNDIVSIVNYDSGVNGLHKVTSVPSLNSFNIVSTSAISGFSSTGTSKLYKFKSSRFDVFDSLPDNKETLLYPEGTKIWIDTDENSKWAVYEKSNNFTPTVINSVANIPNQHLGWSISKRKGNNIVVVGSPGYVLNDRWGRVGVYAKSGNNLDRQFTYYLNDINTTQYNAVNSFETEFGYSVFYDDIDYQQSGYGLLFVGAPAAQNTYGVVQSGIVKISSINNILVQDATKLILRNPYDFNYSRFGSSIFVVRNSLVKSAYIGAPATATTGTGAVYKYTIDASTATVTASTPVIVHPSTALPNSQWGYSISGSDDGSVVAISAPGYLDNTGYVELIIGSSRQVINSPYGVNANFGHKVLVSPDGSYLFVGVPNLVNPDLKVGAVLVYKKTNNTFVLDQTLVNPSPYAGLTFGVDIDINAENNELIISALGTDKSLKTTFDKDSNIINETTFDTGSTDFYGAVKNSGTAYIFNRHDKRFIISYELPPGTSAEGSDYGYSVLIDDDSAYVGAPAYDSASTSQLYQYNKIDATVKGWKKIRYQEDLVAIDSIQKIMLIDTFNEDVLNYLDIIDPAKNKIAGIADQELSYRTSFDPAVYSVGTAGTSVDTNINWLDSHVGELWWDLSTVKFQWYEQGDSQFRKNQWGKVFPGASIDVYEWVATSLLPSEWSAQADTNAGLALNISGQPKYVDDSTVSIKSIYNSVTDTFTNIYYYWIKNSVITPSAKNRRISSYEVASIISDPKAYGLKYAEILSANAVALSNVSGELIDSRINLHIATDSINNDIPRHTEWLLLQEGLSYSNPNTLLEKKLLDSLIGHDSLGNEVPDPALPARLKYGIEIRPRQSMFKNRLTALRNLIDFTNEILIKNRIVSTSDLTLLNSQELIPTVESLEYDQIVEDNVELSLIDTSLFTTAKLSCVVSNGRIVKVNIVNAGRGYLTSPKVMVVSSQGVNASIIANIDSFGRIISTTIENSGSGFVDSPVLVVRQYSVIVLADSSYNGKWSKFEWDSDNSRWIRSQTQRYNTTLYWNYVDWSSDDYNQFIDYTSTVDYVYQLNSLSLKTGQYVKVKDNGTGNYLILKKVEALGTFTDGFDAMYVQNGTIQISSEIWDLTNNNLGYDKVKTYDQTLYDQAPDIELQNILLSLKNNIFINNLKVNWNLFFFKAVKYALSEQKLLDWAFKTSFISVTNIAGNLDQRPVYKLTSSTYFENYIEEVKPYHTQIRDFTENYSLLDLTNSTFTDITRNTDTTIRFDRVSSINQIGEVRTTDTFIGNGSVNAFVLNWLAQPDKSKISITLNGLIVLSSDYTIKYYTELYNGYNKKFCKVVFINTVPRAGQILEITYNKSTDIQSSVERIDNFYSPTSGMPGIDISQLMTGVEYPKTRIDTLPFNYSTGWDLGSIPFGTSSWEDGVGFYASTTVTNTATTGTKVISLGSVTGLVAGQYANIISSITNKFYSTNTTIKSISGNNVTFSSTLTSNVYPGDVIEFWTYDGNSKLLDSAIDGGSWVSGVKTTALGINPEDITIDGDSFYSPNISHGPEELVPGQLAESLGISVYTKQSQGAPSVFFGSFEVKANTTASVSLSVMPTTVASVIVTSGYTEFAYTTSTNLAIGEFTLDWQNNTLSAFYNVDSIVGYTIVSVGGGAETGAGVVDYGSVVVNDQSQGQVISLSDISSIYGAIVTVNGQAISAQTTSTDFGYVLSAESNYSSRAAVTVYNLPAGINQIQVWFLATSYSYVNEIKEQYIPIVDTNIKSYTLSYPPGTIEPAVEQVIVEQVNSLNERQRLTPPYASYYKISNGIKTFLINNKKIRAQGIYSVENGSVRAYVNGIKLRPGFDFTVDPTENTITLAYNVSNDNDVLAIVDLYSQPGDSYDYDLEGATLTLSSPTANTQIRIITYTNQDSMLMRTERFNGDTSNRFVISRPIVNTNYVWVSINGIPLVPNYDYTVLEDGITIQVSDSFVITPADTIVIISIADQNFSSNILGYRIFNDMLNRTTFKRLSKHNTTYLTKPLNFTDTEINLADASIITPPIPNKKIPGVVIIDGERIEFFKMKGNKLTQLRRSTLGTSPAFYSDVYTKVIDQGNSQTMPFVESILKQTQYTTSTNKVYNINTVTTSTGVITGDGISLSTTISGSDQISVYYGGRLLNKVGTYKHNTTISYDSQPANILGTVSIIDNLPLTTSLNDAYCVTSTNQVWVYTNSIESDAVNGYVYRGLNYIPPEFTVNTSLNQITLNIEEGLGDNIKLVIIKKQFANTALWNNGISLLDSTTIPAQFLQAHPAELPDNYYYGGNNVLITETGFALTDNNNKPLQGI
jgi:hypothetical protein